MWIRALRLTNFRNYEQLELELDEGLNFFTGSNGSGKTSVLEAVSYLAVARSLRGAGDAEVIRWGESEFGVSGDIVTNGSSRTTKLRYSRGGSKEVTLDGESLTKLSDLVGVLRVAWFCPEDTWLTKGGPAERRKLLDMTLCQPPCEQDQRPRLWRGRCCLLDLIIEARVAAVTVDCGVHRVRTDVDIVAMVSSVVEAVGYVPLLSRWFSTRANSRVPRRRAGQWGVPRPRAIASGACQHLHSPYYYY